MILRFDNFIQTNDYWVKTNKYAEKNDNSGYPHFTYILRVFLCCGSERKVNEWKKWSRNMS